MSAFVQVITENSPSKWKYFIYKASSPRKTIKLLNQYKWTEICLFVLMTSPGQLVYSWQHE